MKCGEIWARRKRSSNCTARRRERSSSASCSWVETNSATSPLRRSRLAGADESRAMIAPTTTSSVVMGTTTPPWSEQAPPSSHVRSWGERTWGRPLAIASCTVPAASVQCAASMPSAASIPKVSAMATPVAPISWRRWRDRSLRRAVVEAGPQWGAARFAVWRVAKAARCVGVPSRRSERTAKRITTTITTTTPTRAIHSASFIGPLRRRDGESRNAGCSPASRSSVPYGHRKSAAPVAGRHLPEPCRSSHADDRSSHELRHFGDHALQRRRVPSHNGRVPSFWGA